MSTKKPKMDINQNTPFLRLMTCILFLPCFFLIDKGVSPILYFIALTAFLYALVLFLFPQINESLHSSYPFTVLFDIAFISLFIYFEKKYALAFSIFYIFPIVTLAFHNNTFWTYLTATLSGAIFILLSIHQNLYLPPVIVQVIIFFILSFFTLTLAQNFHTSCFQLANLDTLTKIHNRRFFNQSLNSLVRKNIPFSLILLDLDNFKQLNDTEGHHSGDYVLKIIAAIMKKYTRATDIIARFGGDEFAIILPKTSKGKSKTIAERIRNSVLVSPKFIPYSQVGLSMGIATYPHDGKTVDEIVQKADEALYVAKARGKNYIHLY